MIELFADWQKGITNHPDCNGVPPCGKNLNRVTLNGADVSDRPIVRLRTGPHGWIEEHVKKDGNYEIDEHGGIAVMRTFGEVDWEIYPAAG